MSPATLVALQVAVGVVAGPVLNAVVALGEEWGWRGYLLPRLLPWGTWRALLAHGALWGLWHAPVVLQGYNYPQHPVAGVGFMVVSCVLLGVLFGWLRLASGSVWPCVIAHGSLNALAPAVMLLPRAGAAWDTAEVGVLGWPGWLLMAAGVCALVLTRRLPSPFARPTQSRAHPVV
nr:MULTISPECIES: CPBP family intramembrane glutamic endopeptidase [Myxococcaceae]